MNHYLDIIMFPIQLIVAFFTNIALQQMPGLANPEEAFARSMMSAMPAGLRALMMSAILAAVVTSGESSESAAEVASRKSWALPVSCQNNSSSCATTFSPARIAESKPS